MRPLLALTFAGLLFVAVRAADRTEVGFAGGRIFPESITSTRNGTLIIGSLGLDSVYRALPDSTRAESWIAPKSNGLQNVLGVYADEAANILWVCTSASGGRGGAPVVGETAVKSFDLSSGAFKASYPYTAPR